MSDKPLRNFDRFEKGHYYVYTGEKKLSWIVPKESVLDHKIHKCLDVWDQLITSASFADVKWGVWDWEDGFDNWVEVESPEAVFEIGDDCLRYDKIHQHWKVAKVHEGYFHNDKNKNGYNNEVGIHYICKRKSNKKEEPKENVLCETPIKMSLGSIQKEPMVLNFDFKMDESRELSRALSEWVSLCNDKLKDIDKKENVFKKYIRTKKYMKFVKEKKR